MRNLLLYSARRRTTDTATLRTSAKNEDSKVPTSNKARAFRCVRVANTFPTPLLAHSPHGGHGAQAPVRGGGVLLVDSWRDGGVAAEHLQPAVERPPLRVLLVHPHHPPPARDPVHRRCKEPQQVDDARRVGRRQLCHGAHDAVEAEQPVEAQRLPHGCGACQPGDLQGDKGEEVGEEPGARVATRDGGAARDLGAVPPALGGDM